jgi:hypothetical protein
MDKQVDLPAEVSEGCQHGGTIQVPVTLAPEICEQEPIGSIAHLAKVGAGEATKGFCRAGFMGYWVCH